MVSKVPNFAVSSHKQSRNAFDLSQSHLLQAAPGQLLPIFNINLIPEDSVKINVTDFVKSMPIVQSPLCDARGVYEFFFVPYHQLWHNFDQFITQMNDYRSIAFALENPPSAIPSFTSKRSHKVGNSNVSTFVGSPLDLSLQLPKGKQKNQISYLYDLLGYCPFVDSNGDNLNLNISGAVPSNSLPDYSLNLFSLAAYNKIYQDWYRKTSYESFDVTSYSLDSIPSAPSSNWFENKLTIHQRNYGLDLLTNLRPSASLNVNGQSVFNNIIPQMFGTDSFNGEVPSYQGLPSSSNNKNSTGLAFQNVDNTAFSVSSIRAAFALDKLSQLIGRAEKDYKSQMKAVYGVNVSTGRDGKCIFIDGFSSDISFGEIDNTNGASFNNSYSTYGKVFGSGGGSITFKAPEFGILMCIYSIIPFVPYDSTKVDLFNTKHTYQDYFNPMYQHLGLQPLYKAQYSCLTGADANPLTTAYGWQPRYSEYKTAIDTNHGSFINSQPLRSFTASRVRTLSPYATQLQLSDLKISPNVFDSVFTTNFDDTLNTYPFFNKVSFNVIKVSAMDSDSLPLL